MAPTINEDNYVAIKMARSRFSRRWTRQVDVKHHVVRDVIIGGVVCAEHVCS